MKISKELHDMICDWLSDNLISIKSNNIYADTAAIRTAFMHTHRDDDGNELYIDNDTINDIMLELGFKATNFENSPYLQYAVSQNSPALRIYRDISSGRHLS